MKVPSLYTGYRDKIKLALKAQGITYATLGERMRLSVSGVKKLLAARDVSLDRLAQLCAAAEISMIDLISDGAEPDSAPVELSHEAQMYFLNNRECLNLFMLLLSEPKPLKEILRDHKIPQRRAYEHLRKLDELKLVKWMRGDRVVLLFKQPARFRYSGPLLPQLFAEWSHQLLGDVLKLELEYSPEAYFSLRVLHLLPETKKEFLHAMDAVIQEYGKRSIREKKYFPRDVRVLRLLAAVADGHLVK